MASYYTRLYRLSVNLDVACCEIEIASEFTSFYCVSRRKYWELYGEIIIANKIAATHSSMPAYFILSLYVHLCIFAFCT